MVEDVKAVDATTKDEKSATVVEQDPRLEETFDEPCLEEVRFRNSWTLWEHYEPQDGA